MEGGSDPPLPQGVEEDIVILIGLVSMELVEQAMTGVELVRILERSSTLYYHSAVNFAREIILFIVSVRSRGSSGVFWLPNFDEISIKAI